MLLSASASAFQSLRSSLTAALIEAMLSNTLRLSM